MSRVLCVEDHQDSCEMIALLLRSVDPTLKVETAGTGKAAIELISKSPFDAYLLDMAMPDMDGAALCRWIRERDGNVPVVFYSATAEATSRQLALDAGADEFLVKPNDIDRVGMVLARLLKYGEDPVVRLSGRGK